MKAAFDSSILVAALAPNETEHARCFALLCGKGSLYAHGLLETFSNLTGGRRETRLSPSVAAQLLRRSALPLLTVTELAVDEQLAALDQAEAAGVRGGAVYDYLHLVAARKAKAKVFYTLNLSDFRALRRDGDPAILHPSEMP